MAQVAAVKTAPAAGGRASAGRLIGVDLARGLAVVGMYAAHVGPDPAEGGAAGFVMELAHGRASALFAVLAGFSIVLITGRSVPKVGRAGRQAVAKVVIRAVVLLVVGTALTMAGSRVEVILAFYGLYFLLVLPLYRLSMGRLAVIAAAGALVLPQVLYVVRQLLYSGSPDGPGGMWAWPGEADGIVSLLCTGTYPALTWVPFVIAGMAVARLDLGSASVRRGVAVAGAALAVVGHGGSWLALHLIPGVATAIGSSGWATSEGGSATSAWWSDTAGYPAGDTPAWLWAASPHSETTLSIVASTGVAIAILVACIGAVEAFPHFRLARPVIAVGAMSLTAYVFHIVAIGLLGIEQLPGSPVYVLVGFVASAVSFATLWSRHFPRGPLEWMLGQTTKIAERVT
jgi:uncharacterized membrane protein YeiB